MTASETSGARTKQRTICARKRRPDPDKHVGASHSAGRAGREQHEKSRLAAPASQVHARMCKTSNVAPMREQMRIRPASTSVARAAMVGERASLATGALAVTNE